MYPDEIQNRGCSPDKVLSFDSNKVRFISSGIGRLVEKITKITEFRNIVLATGYLKKNPPPLIQNRYTIQVVPIIDWLDEHILVTKFFKKNNFEHFICTFY